MWACAPIPVNDFLYGEKQTRTETYSAVLYAYSVQVSTSTIWELYGLPISLMFDPNVGF